MSDNSRTTAFWSRLRIVLVVMAAVGIAGSIWNESLPWPWSQHLVRDFSVALFVAGLLAASVDAIFKTELARDVFNAAFSYVLPDELK